jgi:hypothetical protein
MPEIKAPPSRTHRYYIVFTVCRIVSEVLNSCRYINISTKTC